MPAANVPSRPSPPRTWFSCAGRSLGRRDSSRGKGRRPALCSRAAALPQRRATPGGLSFGGAGGAGALCRLRDGGGRHAGRRFGAHRWTARQRVVQGKSVTVRVVLGGRRSSKTKKQRQ